MNKSISALILALIVADVLFDALFIASLANAETEDEEENEHPSYESKHPLIGRRYRVGDNSYIRDLKTDCEGGLYGREVIIVSPPYVERVDGEDRLFVNVFSTDSARDYRVLFNEGWLID